jgi:hypothetical protein
MVVRRVGLYAARLLRPAELTASRRGRNCVCLALNLDSLEILAHASRFRWPGSDDGTIDTAATGNLTATLRELANYGAAALVFGQFVGEVTMSWWRILAGGAIWLALVILALGLEGE